MNETLAASLVAVAQEDGIRLDDERYFDWSMPHEDGRSFEIGVDGECVQLDMTRAEMLALHAALTRTLIEMNK